MRLSHYHQAQFVFPRIPLRIRRCFDSQRSRDLFYPLRGGLHQQSTCKLMYCDNTIIYRSQFLGLPAPVVIYVESFARVTSLSLSGKLLRPLVDRRVFFFSKRYSYLANNVSSDLLSSGHNHFQTKAGENVLVGSSDSLFTHRLRVSACPSSDSATVLLLPSTPATSRMQTRQGCDLAHFTPQD